MGRRRPCDRQSRSRRDRGTKALNLPYFSRRLHASPPANELARLISENRRLGRPFIDLCGSNPTRCGFNFYDHAGARLAAPLHKHLSDPKNLRYDPDPQGLLSARRAVAAYYKKKGAHVLPEQVFLTASTSEAYHFLFRLLCDAGDSVACAEPSYPLFETLGTLDDVALKKYRLAYDGRWRADLGSLGTAVPGCKALLAVHPNHPTGHFVSEDERGEMNRLSAAHGFALIVDEVFSDFVWQGKAPPSFADNERPTFTLSGLSKILGLPQMKLSWIVVSGPEVFRRDACERLETISDAYLSVNTPSQRALPRWLSSRAPVRREILERVRANRRFLEKEIKANRNVEVLHAEGGWHAVIRFRGKSNDEDTAIRLFREKSVLVHPGYFYDMPSEDMLVLSLLPPVKIFNEGVRRLIEGL